MFLALASQTGWSIDSMEAMPASELLAYHDDLIAMGLLTLDE